MVPPESSISVVEQEATMAREVVAGLSTDPKRIPSRYLYDALGSRLFEAICALPWYRITRAERALLRQHAPAILEGLGASPTLIELGGGNGEKLSLLLSAGSARAVTAHLIDISGTALADAAATVASRSDVRVVTHEATYGVGLAAAQADLDEETPALVLFLGSNIGNMSAEESNAFLVEIRRGCRVGDRLLLGTDLVKPEADLRLAYDDPLGVTAAFNKNLLVRLNREFDGDFDLEAFDYRVAWNQAASRVEAYLVSRVEQLVCLQGVGCCTTFGEGEPLWTESSHKYEPEQVVEMTQRASFAPRQQWVDPEARFALTLVEAVGNP